MRMNRSVYFSGISGGARSHIFFEGSPVPEPVSALYTEEIFGGSCAGDLSYDPIIRNVLPPLGVD